MRKFKFTRIDIQGLYIIKPIAFGDDRGYFMESYKYKDFKEAGLNMVFVQDNRSKPEKEY